MRRLSAEERALWDKVVASVRPLHAEAAAAPEGPPPAPQPAPEAPKPKGRVPKPRSEPPRAPVPVRPGTTLDGSWDRRIGRGAIQPDVTLDLHGHNLATAYHLLDARLEQAIGMGARVMLLVTGKPPQGDERPVARGAIRSAVGDWLAVSRHAGSIAAVRAAHPRHGGAGALYIVLRRPKTA